MKWSEKTQSGHSVTVPQIVLDLLPRISDGFKSEMSWEWPALEDSTDRPNSGNGKNKEQTMHTLVTQPPEIIGSLQICYSPQCTGFIMKNQPCCECSGVKHLIPIHGKQRDDRKVMGEEVEMDIVSELVIQSLQQTLP